MKFKGSKTEKNLYKTFASKSRNYARYMIFSEKARMDGYRWIQKEFEILAENELAHAREAYGAYLNLLGRTENNIQESINIEILDKSRLYEVFELEAKEEGFNDVIPYFNGLTQICDNHARKLNKLDNTLKSTFEDNVKRKCVCINCGYIYEAYDGNVICPVCKYTKSYYKPLD